MPRVINGLDMEETKLVAVIRQCISNCSSFGMEVCPVISCDRMCPLALAYSQVSSACSTGIQRAPSSKP